MGEMRSPKPRHPDQVEASRRLRLNATDAERLLWQSLRKDALGVRFRRQHPIGRYIVDFACVEARLVVEVDGGQHGPERDGERDASLSAAGWQVLRYWNNEVMEHLAGVVADISRAIAERVVKGSPPP